jgi:hypothetical protein
MMINLPRDVNWARLLDVVLYARSGMVGKITTFMVGGLCLNQLRTSYRE